MDAPFLITAIIVGALVAGLTVAVGVRPNPVPAKERLPAWRWLSASVLGAAALLLAGATHYVEGWGICTTKTLITPAISESQTSQSESITPHASVPGVTTASSGTSLVTTFRPESTQIETQCRGVGVGEFVPLLLPALLLVLPAIKTLDLAGLLKLELKDLKVAVDQQKETVEEVHREVQQLQVQFQVATQQVNITVVDRELLKGESDIQFGRLRDLEAVLAEEA